MVHKLVGVVAVFELIELSAFLEEEEEGGWAVQWIRLALVEVP